MRFREFILNSGRKIFLGRNSENNDELVSNSKRNDLLLHTSTPGSPFCNVGVSPNKEEIKEAGIICAHYSQTWKKSKTKKDILVDVFSKADTFKDLKMKSGTWGVKKKKTIKIKKEDIIKFEAEVKKI